LRPARHITNGRTARRFEAKNIDAESKSGLDTHMKTKTSLLTLTLCFAAAAVCFAADPLMGTWKLNEAKSKLDPEGPKNQTVVYEAAGDKVKITVDGTNPDGKAMHHEWTGKFDGKDYPVTGEAGLDVRSYKKVNDHTLDFTVKKNGKVQGGGRVVVATNGKSRTVTMSGTNPKGKKFKTTAVYDKQ
jgi:hypothetical protein